MIHPMTNTSSSAVYSSLWAPANALNRISLKDQVTSLVRENILKGKLPSGSKLIERELAESLGVSRMPVHDALIQLEKEGLVVTKTDARYVIQLTRQDLFQLFQVRVVLERLAAELAAKNTTTKNAENFEEILYAMKDAVELHAMDTFIDRHTKFHRMIWQQASNPQLLRAMDSILGPILMFMARSEYINWDNSLERHRAIVEAINAGDQAAAGEYMARHILQSLERVMQSFDTEM